MESGSSPETYTLNKGEKIVMCIQNFKHKNKILHDDLNLLMFVGIHELAHIMSESTDHTQEFWSNFKFLLHQATRWSFYIPIDYAYQPTTYCNMVIHDNPYFYEKSVEEILEPFIDVMLNR
jgi:hypothetical protein